MKEGDLSYQHMAGMNESNIQYMETSEILEKKKRERDHRRKSRERKAAKKATGPQYKPMPALTRSSLEPVRDKLKKYISSLPAEKKIEHKYVMKVKGKCLNQFLGIIKSDLARLAVEGFP